MAKAVILGATGAIGKKVLEECIHNEYYEKIYLFGRSSILNISINKKVERFVIDFENIGEISDVILENADVFACLGTTLKLAGSKEKQRLIDYQYTVNFAQKCEDKVKSFAVVSAIGADAKKPNFYLGLKQELETTLSKMNLGILRIIRPSLLIAKREDRKLENIGNYLAPVVSIFLIGKLSEYKAIKVENVAKSMVHYAVNNLPSKVYTYKDFVK